MIRTRFIAVVTLVALAGIVAGCGDDDAVQTGSDKSPGTTEDHSRSGHTAPDDVVISISVAGGFVPRGADFAAVPTLVLRDGTVITGGASTAIYPGGPVPPVVTGHVAREEVEALIEAAAEAGLDAQPVDAGQPGITDVPTTTIRVDFQGTTRAHEIYGLGVGDHSPGLTRSQNDLRLAVAGFVTKVTDAVGAAAEESYEPVGYQVLAFPVTPADMEGLEVAPNELAWPLAELPLPEQGCIDVEGPRAAVLTEALGEATQITVWRDGAGRTWQLAVRLRLPGDVGCNP